MQGFHFKQFAVGYLDELLGRVAHHLVPLIKADGAKAALEGFDGVFRSTLHECESARRPGARGEDAAAARARATAGDDEVAASAAGATDAADAGAEAARVSEPARAGAVSPVGGSRKGSAPRPKGTGKPGRMNPGARATSPIDGAGAPASFAASSAAAEPARATSPTSQDSGSESAGRAQSPGTVADKLAASASPRARAPVFVRV